MVYLNLEILHEHHPGLYHECCSVERLVDEYIVYSTERDSLFELDKQLKDCLYGLENMLALYGYKVNHTDYHVLDSWVGCNIDSISMEGIIDGIKTFIQKIIAFIKRCFGFTAKQDKQKAVAVKNIESAKVVPGTGPTGTEQPKSDNTDTKQEKSDTPKATPSKDEPKNTEQQEPKAQPQKTESKPAEPSKPTTTPKVDKQPAAAPKVIYADNKYTIKFPKYFEEDAQAALRGDTEKAVKRFKEELDSIVNIDVNKISADSLEISEFNAEKLQDLYTLGSHSMEGKYLKQWGAVLNKCYDEISVNQYLMTYNKKIKEIESKLGGKVSPKTAAKLQKALKSVSAAVSAVTKYRNVMFACIMDINNILMRLPK